MCHVWRKQYTLSERERKRERERERVWEIRARNLVRNKAEGEKRRRIFVV